MERRHTRPGKTCRLAELVVGTFDEVRVAVRQAAAQRVQVATARMTDDLKRDAPDVTGELRRKTGAEFTGETRREVRAEAVMDTDYAYYVRNGRKGFSKRENGPVLKFKIAGKTIYAHSVGPAEANPFFDNIIDRWGQYLNAADT